MGKQIKKEPLENDFLQVVDADKKSKKALVPVLDLEKFSVSQLPEYRTKKEDIKNIIELNPIVEIIDNATYESAKKSRTAVKTLRTGLEKEQSDVKRKIKTHILEVVDKEYDLLVLGVKKEEASRQDPITAYETLLEEKRTEKARLEKERIDNIKLELDKYSDEWKDAFNLMTFQTIDNIGNNFVESYTTYDTAILEEFESLFPTKVEELTKVLADKVKLLTDAENARIEKEQKDLELKRTRELIAAGFSFDGNNYFVSDFKRLDMGTILRLSGEDFESILSAGKVELARLAKIESDKLEKLEEEKEAIYEIRKNRLLELGLKYSDEHDTIYVDADSDFILLCSEIKEESAIEFEKTIAESKQAFQDFNAEPIPEVVEAVIMVDGYSTSENTPALLPETIKGIEVEEKAIELIENVDSSAPANTTVNVCYDLPKDISPGLREDKIFTGNTVPKDLASLIPKSFVAPTWKTIQEEFKASGEKSYSLWLKNNYNVPTKIQ